MTGRDALAYANRVLLQPPDAAEAARYSGTGSIVADIEPLQLLI